MMLSGAEKNRLSFLGCFIWALTALFFLYEFFLRVFVGTIADELSHTLLLGAERLSLIGAAYFWTYGLMQLPVGLLVDRFSLRALLTGASFICALGVFLFAYFPNFPDLLIGRLLMGLGSSFGFICLLKVSLNWFSHKHFGFLSGLSQLVGAAGPVLAGAPLVSLLNRTHDNWQTVMLIVAFFGLIISVLIGIFVRSKPKEVSTQIIYLETKSSLTNALFDLFKNRQSWMIVLYSIFVNTSLAFLGIVWGTTYLEARQITQSKASFICSLIWVGYALGSPILGIVSDRIKRRKSILVFSSFCGIFAGIMLLCSSDHLDWLYMIAFFVFGIASSGQSLSFAVIAEHVKPKTEASAFGLNNASIFISTSLLIPLFGWMIEIAEPDKILAYQQHDFTTSLILVLFFYFMAFILSAFFIKETFCRQQLGPTVLTPNMTSVVER